MPEFETSRLSNHYQRVGVYSLHTLPQFARPRGPFVVLQKAVDPDDPALEPEIFILSRQGAWMALYLHFQLAWEERLEHFTFATAAELVRLLEELPHEPMVIRPNPLPPRRAPSPSPG